MGTIDTNHHTTKTTSRAGDRVTTVKKLWGPGPLGAPKGALIDFKGSPRGLQNTQKKCPKRSKIKKGGKKKEKKKKEEKTKREKKEKERGGNIFGPQSPIPP